MKNQPSVLKLWMGILAAIVIFCFGFAGQSFAKDDDPHMTGLCAPTQEEIIWQNKHMKQVKKVKLNKIGLERINQWRKQKEQQPLTEEEAGVVEKGQEIEGIVGEVPDGEPSAGESTPIGLPTYVDNSSFMYFPPIRSQGSIGSCACFSSVYYTMTYMYAWYNGIDAKNGNDTTRFSPKWCYNMINGGEDSGSWFSGAFNIALKNGPATWTEFPYDSDYREWCLDKNVWRNAIDRRFDQTGYVYDVRQDSGIQLLKEMLNNGYILNYATYVNSWQWTTTSDDPNTITDDAYVGEACAFWVNGNAGGHGMTVVGYNDDIWVDVNGNGTVDSGEKGAFKIANSWGSWWKDGGFCWFAYDGLKTTSAVTGGPSSDRQAGWWDGKAYWITPRNYAYQPTMVAEFTINHLKRSQLRMSLGVSDTIRSTPSTTWYPAMIYYQGGPYAFDGSINAVDGTFVFDFTDIVPSGGGENRYYLGMYDSASGDSATLSAYKIIDVFNGNIEAACFDVPKVGDAGQEYAYVDYYYDDGNVPPTAVAAAISSTTGAAPLTVSFDGSGSSDFEDGSVSSYSWNFGDGVTGSEALVDHIYTSAGNYTATLTVADSRGATDSAAVAITVTEPPPKEMHVSDISMSVNKTGKNVNATATVTIIDEDGHPVSNATVSGSWSGLVSGSASGITGSNGSVTLTSPKSKQSGIFTFTITNVSSSGFIYDEGASVTYKSINSDGSSTNQDPVADAGSNQTVDVDTTVTFDGSGSSDDGSIVTYAWDFGDGSSPGGSVAPTHIYSSAGTYTVTLTVTDNEEVTDSDTTVITVIDGSANQDPVADAGSNQTVDLGDTVTFDGTGSSDPEGSSLSYAWDFGDGSSPGSGVAPTHDYLSAGTYTVTLTVTDNEEATDSDTTVITVIDGSANQDPVADAGPNQTVDVGDTVTFDGSGSSDDGSIVTYAWDFGDGSSPGSGVAPTHDYLSADTYTATLTVTDNEGATDSDTVVITVESTDPNLAMYVSDITMSVSTSKAGNTALATVTIISEGSPVANATVTGEWSGLVGGIVTGVTGSDGKVTLTSRKNKKSGDFVFTVTNVTAGGYDYDATKNVVTSNSISNL